MATATAPRRPAQNRTWSHPVGTASTSPGPGMSHGLGAANAMLSMVGMTAENLAQRYQIDRDAQQRFAVTSQQRAASAAALGDQPWAIRSTCHHAA